MAVRVQQRFQGGLGVYGPLGRLEHGAEARDRGAFHLGERRLARETEREGMKREELGRRNTRRKKIKNYG